MAVEALAAAVLISCLTVTSVIQSHKKKPSLIRSPVNTAKFFWPIGNRINWVRLYKKERVVYHFTVGSKRRNGRFFLLTSIGKTVYSLTWIVIFFFTREAWTAKRARGVTGKGKKRTTFRLSFPLRITSRASAPLDRSFWLLHINRRLRNIWGRVSLVSSHGNNENI